MTPLRPVGTTRALAENQEEYTALAIKDEVVAGLPCMTSIWEPTPKELELLKRGGSIKLHIRGYQHPPVMLTVQPPPQL